MKITKQHKQSKCRSCGSKNLLTISLDQLCCDCDWSNSKMLVDLGQMDRMGEASIQHFFESVSFDDLEDKATNEPNQQALTA